MRDYLKSVELAQKERLLSKFEDNRTVKQRRILIEAEIAALENMAKV